MENSLLPTSIPADSAGHGVPPSLAPTGRRAWTALALSVLILVALSLRLHTAWQRKYESPDELALRLVGDETNYEGLAGALLQGAFFQWPRRVPVYPLFIAAIYYALGERSPAKLLYVQAFVGAVTVPLTYLLARRLMGDIPALGAAGIVTLNASLAICRI